MGFEPQIRKIIEQIRVNYLLINTINFLFHDVFLNIYLA